MKNRNVSEVMEHNKGGKTERKKGRRKTLRDRGGVKPDKIEIKKK